MEHDYKDNVKGQDVHSMYYWRVIRSYADFYYELLGIGTENPFVVGRKELDLAKEVMLGFRKWGYYNDRTLEDLAQTHHLIPRDIGTRLAGLSILDIGSGQGKLGQDLAQEYGVESYHLDLDLDTLQGGEEYGAQAVINGDGANLPFRDESFDATVGLYAAHIWTCDPVARAKVLIEQLRVTKTGGVAFVAPLLVNILQRRGQYLRGGYLKDQEAIADKVRGLGEYFAIKILHQLSVRRYINMEWRAHYIRPVIYSVIIDKLKRFEQGLIEDILEEIDSVFHNRA